MERPRPIRPLARAALAAALACVVPVHGRAAESDDLAVLREDVGHLRTALERAYLDVQRDHARVRVAAWADTTLDEEFTALLDALVREARTRPTARQHAEGVADTVRALEARRIVAPLTRTSLHVVLAATAHDGLRDRAGTSRALFVAAAKRVFAEPKVEDAWDACFLSLPVVEAYRGAHARLAAALDRASQPPPAEKPSDAAPAEPPPRPIEYALIECDRTRPWLGPWSGWTTDLAEAKNRRQQRNVKTVGSPGTELEFAL